jgi:hypothetical protein
MGNYRDREVRLAQGIRRANCSVIQSSWYYSHHRQVHSSRLHDKRQLQEIGISLDQQCPRSEEIRESSVGKTK